MIRTLVAAAAAVGLCVSAAWAGADHPPSVQLSKLLRPAAKPAAHTVTSSMSPNAVIAANLPPAPRPERLASLTIPAVAPRPLDRVRPVSLRPASAAIPAPLPKPLDLARAAKLRFEAETLGDRIHSDGWLDDQEAAKGGAEWKCLSEALYFEARGENATGLFAVAEVILNRVDSKRYPDSVCGVINQGTGRKFACQFTYTCDGRPENINEHDAWTRVGKVARAMLDGAPRTLTEGALYYHTKYVSPSWAVTKALTNTIGVHRFYR